MKILVTGGAGFIGSAVVRLAVSRRHAVVNLDVLTYTACLENVTSVADSLLHAFGQADICDSAALDRILAKYAPDAFIQTNTTGTYTLLEAARACQEIAQALLRNPNISGTYHFCGAPSVSWADFAREIFRQAQITCTVENIPSSAYPTPAERPKNSRMNCESLSVFPVAQSDWRISLTKVLKKLEQLS